MNSHRIDKNVPFYLGFYKYRDMAISPNQPEGSSKKIPKTLNSLDFGSMVSKHKALRRPSNSRQSEATESKDCRNSQQRSDIFESYERTTFRQSTEIVRRNSLSTNKYNPRMSIQTSNIHRVNDAKARKSAYVIDRSNIEEHTSPQGDHQSNTRWFDYSTQDPAYKSELLNYKLNINFKDGINQLGKTQSIFKSRNQDFEEKAADSRSSFNFIADKKPKIFTATTALDSDLISFSKLIKASAKKKPITNCAPTMQNLIPDQLKEVENTTSVDYGLRMTNPSRTSISGKKTMSTALRMQISGIKSTMQLRRLAINVNKIWMRKAFSKIKRHSKAIILAKATKNNVHSAARRLLRTGFKTILSSVITEQLIIKASLNLRKSFLNKKQKWFWLLKLFVASSKLNSLIKARKQSHLAQFIQSLKISMFSHQIKDMHRSLMSSPVGSTKGQSKISEQPLQGLKIFSSFLIQLRLILDDPRRDLRTFFRLLKQREALGKLMQIHFDKKTKILKSQALLALRKLKIFAKYRRQLYKAFMSRKLA